MKKGIGDRFQMETKYQRGKIGGGALLWRTKPEPYKVYPKAPKIPLKHPPEEATSSLWTIIASRRSVRDFRPDPLAKTRLSRLLWATQGITRTENGYDHRAAPSAGALYPTETYLVVHNVEDIAPGVYHYAVRTHELEQLKRGDFRLPAAEAALDQGMVYAAGVVFVWTAVFGRSKWKYGQRAYRYVYLDAGHIAQNLALAVTALGLGACPIAALYDDEVNRLLDIDGEEESVIYMSVVGHPR